MLWRVGENPATWFFFWRQVVVNAITILKKVREDQVKDDILTTIRDELYKGSWDGMLCDLRARLAAVPHIPTLDAKINRDIAIINRIRKTQ
jgi:hypothetical protein